MIDKCVMELYVLWYVWEHDQCPLDADVDTYLAESAQVIRT